MGCLAWHAKAWCPTFFILLGSTDTMCKSSCTFALTQTSHLSCNGTTANFPVVDCNGTMCIWLVLLVTSAIPATMIITFTIAHTCWRNRRSVGDTGFPLWWNALLVHNACCYILSLCCSVLLFLFRKDQLNPNIYAMKKGHNFPLSNSCKKQTHSVFVKRSLHV